MLEPACIVNLVRDHFGDSGAILLQLLYSRRVMSFGLKKVTYYI